MKTLFSYTLFKRTILWAVFFELISYGAHIVPQFETFAASIVLFVIALVTLEDYRYGIYIALAELVMGSQGYLLSLDVVGTAISIRMGIFLVLVSTGIIHCLRHIRSIQKNVKEPLWLWYTFAAAAVVFGIINGMYRGNNFSNILFDANGFFYYALFPAFVYVINSRDRLYQAISVISGALFVSILKTIILLYFFSHSIWTHIPVLYRWVRDTRVGEITNMGGDIFRIFFQSHIYVAIALLVLVTFFMLGEIIPAMKKRARVENKHYFQILSIALLSGILLLSMSRSFWIGFLGTATMLTLLFWIAAGNIIDGFSKIVMFYFSIAAISIAILGSIVYFPIPNPNRDISAGDVFTSRATSLSDAAVSSRWALLPKLLGSVQESLFIGKGFGATVTYTSSDPRVRLSTAGGTGIYTTYAFEWGYLDQLLKIGILGLFAYLSFLGVVFMRGLSQVSWPALKSFNSLTVDKQRDQLILISTLLGCLLLGIVHVFTPYLNHPLGIGYVMFAAATFIALEQT